MRKHKALMEAIARKPEPCDCSGDCGHKPLTPAQVSKWNDDVLAYVTSGSPRTRMRRLESER